MQNITPRTGPDPENPTHDEPENIEQIVGIKRHQWEHYGRYNPTTHTLHILHSQACLDCRTDPATCKFTIAHHTGLNPEHWQHFQDRPIRLTVFERKTEKLLIPHPTEPPTT